ncbi:hypothetical protein BXZ70DRAFT_1005686 [Cristinia sonorae]|uniref:Uncharacterized protein n=1 Tax=Cristinia sonorae TaxID=1940300 RepID=A0A8K0UVA8_9AGAR|nr:hypothetical protein BXZ70DRAFT_1005686 [Cristinia sonorae]
MPQASAPRLAQALAAGPSPVTAVEPARAGVPADLPAFPPTAELRTTSVGALVASPAAESSAGGAMPTAGVPTPLGQRSERKSLGIPKSARRSAQPQVEAIPPPTVHAQEDPALPDIASEEQTQRNASRGIPLSRLLELFHLESDNVRTHVFRRIDRASEEPAWIPAQPSTSALDNNTSDDEIPNEPLIIPPRPHDEDFLYHDLFRNGMVDMALLAIEKTVKSRKAKISMVKHMADALNEDRKDLLGICSLAENNILHFQRLSAATEPFLLHRGRRPV